LSNINETGFQYRMLLSTQYLADLLVRRVTALLSEGISLLSK
jgi:hypothetical protein